MRFQPKHPILKKLRRKFNINGASELITDESGESLYLVSRSRNQWLCNREMFLVYLVEWQDLRSYEVHPWCSIFNFYRCFEMYPSCSILMSNHSSCQNISWLDMRSQHHVNHSWGFLLEVANGAMRLTLESIESRACLPAIMSLPASRIILRKPMKSHLMVKGGGSPSMSRWKRWWSWNVRRCLVTFKASPSLTTLWNSELSFGSLKMRGRSGVELNGKANFCRVW